MSKHKQALLEILKSNAILSLTSAETSDKLVSIYRQLDEIAAKYDACLITLDEAKMEARQI